MRVISYRCQMEQRFIEFGLLGSLLKQMLQIQSDDTTQNEREQYLQRLFDSHRGNELHLRDQLFLLNDVLDVRFQASRIEAQTVKDTNLVQLYEKRRNELLEHILNQLIEPSHPLTEEYGHPIDGQTDE
jgi:hypothetical protein